MRSLWLPKPTPISTFSSPCIALGSVGPECVIERGLADLQPRRGLPYGQPLGDHATSARQLLGVYYGFRPPFRPRAAAAVKPARVRSRIRSRSNCPSAPKRWKTSRPPGVVVSIASVIERNPTPKLLFDRCHPKSRLSGLSSISEFADRRRSGGHRQILTHFSQVVRNYTQP